MIEFMDQNDFQPWIEQTAVQPGVLACGVKASQSTTVRSADASFPERRIKELMLALSEIGLTLRQDHLFGSRWRWIFENGQIHSARRQDGALALLILTNDTTMTSVADSALGEFISTPGPTDAGAETLTNLTAESAAEIANP
jgi:hypothetical protein